MQSILQSLKNVAGMKLLEIIATSFPSAGPFYIGWRMCLPLLLAFSGLIFLHTVIFTTAMHGGFELVLREYSI